MALFRLFAGGKAVPFAAAILWSERGEGPPSLASGAQAEELRTKQISSN